VIERVVTGVSAACQHGGLLPAATYGAIFPVSTVLYCTLLYCTVMYSAGLGASLCCRVQMWCEDLKNGSQSL